MSSVIPIFIGGGKGVGFIKFLGWGVVKKRESPDLRSPEVGISVRRFYMDNFSYALPIRSPQSSTYLLFLHVTS